MRNDEKGLGGGGGTEGRGGRRKEKNGISHWFQLKFCEMRQINIRFQFSYDSRMHNINETNFS